MSHFKKTPFQLSFLAVAVLSLSACSTTPKIAGIDLGKVGSGISKVGSKTVELGSNAWEGTKNVLNIGPPDDEFLDEVDLALMEDDAMPQGVQTTPIEDVAQLLPQGENTDTQLLQNGDANSTLAFGEIPQQPVVNGDVMLLADGTTAQPVAESSENLLVAQAEEVQTVDLTHQVEASDTLWDIAKKTTGDANNWHVIADINNLGPNASVYEGQKLVIPADMVKPEYAGSGQPVLLEELDTAEPAAVALKIPEQTDTAAQGDIVVAAAEEIKPAAAEADPAMIAADATALKVGPGETLWDFAKRTTGDATNWKMIAEKNMFNQSQLGKIRPGQKIYVPTAMVRERDAEGVLIAKGAEGTVPTATAGGVTPENKAALDASAAVLAGTNLPAETDVKEGDIKIVEAAYQDDTGIKPITAETLSEEASVAVAASSIDSGKVMIRGTYYPKAVYNEADFSSSLLMRVSPGTQLVVSKAIGPWLEVTTDKGVGYVHSRDIK